MTKNPAWRRWVRFRTLWMGWIGVGCLVGCQSGGPSPPTRIENPWMGPATLAVAPAINLSGATDFDPDRFADIMASELTYAAGVSVIPVSRVMAVLAEQGLHLVESPQQALELASTLGADAILVFAVTEYDPYDPPRVGITAQLYGRRPRSEGSLVDPVSLSRQPGADGSTGPRTTHRRLLAQTQRVYDAGHQSVLEDVKRFAATRGAGGSPFGWRRYVVSQQDYIRFCCHATIRALLDGQQEVVHP